MDARHLELLRQLADRGTVTAVAAATHRTPSAVSQQLRTAEREAGVPLVEPHGRGLRLTRAGALLADGAVLVATALARVQADLDALRDAPQGAVAIGALPSAAEVLLPELLVRLRGGAIRVTVDDFDLAEEDFARRAGDHDLVIGHTITGDAPRGADHLHRTTLAREPLDVAVPADHPLAGRDELTPDDVVGERWVAVPEGYPFDTVLVAMENLHRPQHRPGPAGARQPGGRGAGRGGGRPGPAAAVHHAGAARGRDRAADRRRRRPARRRPRATRCRRTPRRADGAGAPGGDRGRRVVAGGRAAYRRGVQRTVRRRAYFVLMGTCVVLILLAWNVVRFWSTTAAVVMSVVAAVLPPAAAIVGNLGALDDTVDARWDEPPDERRRS